MNTRTLLIPALFLVACDAAPSFRVAVIEADNFNQTQVVVALTHYGPDVVAAHGLAQDQLVPLFQALSPRWEAVQTLPLSDSATTIVGVHGRAIWYQRSTVLGTSALTRVAETGVAATVTLEDAVAVRFAVVPATSAGDVVVLDNDIELAPMLQLHAERAEGPVRILDLDITGTE